MCLADEENFSKGKRKMFWQTLLDDESLSFNEVRDHVLNLLISVRVLSTLAQKKSPNSNLGKLKSENRPFQPCLF